MSMRSFCEIIKDAVVSDAHALSATAAGRRRRRGQVPVSMIGLTLPPVYPRIAKSDDFHIAVPITKVNDELRTVYGWASINTEKGSLITDHQDDQIEDAEIIKAAHDFMASSRTGGLLHARDSAGVAHRGGEIVESLVLTPDIQKSLGIDIGKTGWFIGYRVDDDDVWSLVKSGTLKAFSIGGKAQRVPI